MKFCPKCGGLMVPVRVEGKQYLQCTKCGYKEKVGKKKEGYTITEKVDKKTKVKTTSVISKPASLTMSEEERQQMMEEYYEVALDLIQEEIEGGEGED